MAYMYAQRSARFVLCPRLLPCIHQSLKTRVDISKTSNNFWSCAYSWLVSASAFLLARHYRCRFASRMHPSMFVRPVLMCHINCLFSMVVSLTLTFTSVTPSWWKTSKNQLSSPITPAKPNRTSHCFGSPNLGNTTLLFQWLPVWLSWSACHPLMTITPIEPSWRRLW